MTTTDLKPTTLDVIVDAQAVLSALKDCKKAVNARCTLPVLAHILLEASPEQNTLTLTTTNLDLYVSRTIPATQVNFAGSICVPYKPFLAFVKNCKQGEALAITVHEYESIEITRFDTATRTDSSSITLTGMQAAEFPRIPIAPEESIAVKLTGAHLKTLVDHTSFACAHDNARPIFTALHLRINNQRIRAEAADTYRLAVQEIFLPTNLSEGALEFSLLPTVTALTAIASIITPGDVVTLRFLPQDNMLFINTLTLHTSCSLINDEYTRYPNIDYFMSSCGKQDSWIACKRENLLRFLEGFQGSTTLSSSFSDDHLLLQGTVQDDDLVIQQSACLIETGVVQLDATHFLLNRSFLLDGVKVFPKESLVTLSWHQPDRAFLLTSPELPNFTYLMQSLYSRG